MSRFQGVSGLVGGLLVGAVVGGGLGYVAALVVPVPITRVLAAGLGVAMGGGVGVVANYLATGTIDEAAESEELTVEADESRPDPQPADLFDSHPDPVLYVVDEGAGPVVRAANAAYAETFDVPADAVTGAPLAEAVMAGAETDRVADAVAAGESLDAVVTCRAADGTRRFRLRTAGGDGVGYLLYTPVDGADGE